MYPISYSIILSISLFALAGADCSFNPSGATRHDATLPQTASAPPPSCLTHPIFPIEATEHAYLPEQLKQLQKHFLTELDQYKAALDSDKIKRIEQTIKLLVLIASNEEQIVTRVKSDGASHLIITELQESNHLVWPGPGEFAAPLEAPSNDEVTIRENLREGAHLLTLAGTYLGKHPHGWRDFFENAFFENWSCIPYRLNKLRPWVETRAKGRPPETAVFYLITNFQADQPKNSIKVPGDSFDMLVGILALYYRENILFRQLYEKPGNELKPKPQIGSLPEYFDHYTKKIVSDWIFATVKQSYAKTGKATTWGSTAFFTESNISKSLSSQF